MENAQNRRHSQSDALIAQINQPVAGTVNGSLSLRAEAPLSGANLSIGRRPLR
jgi:hypothetical protein